MKKILTSACVGMFMAMSALSASAGNIPQYKFSQSRVAQMANNVENRVFKYLEGGTEVKSSWFGENLIFANGSEINIEGNGPGFEIGFPFVFGGKTFTHFAIDNCGVIFLGDENGISFNGMTGTIFQEYYVGGYDDTFYFGMHYPPVESEVAEYKGGEIHYKTEGIAGSRKCTVEYKNIRLNGQSSKYIGLFDLQIVMHESGQIDMIFNELSSPHNKQYFDVGLRGWENSDALLIGTAGLGTDAKVSSERIIPRNDWSDTERVIWDGEDDFDHAYLVTYTFTPDNNKTAPQAAPTSLKAVQHGDQLEISCKRAENSDATIILMSETPVSDMELPQDGITYGVKSTLGEYISKIGNATVVYYDNDQNIKFGVDEFKNGQDYYFTAIACTGYPAYNTKSYATERSVTAQDAPKSLTAEAGGKDMIHLTWESENTVIIAKTLQPVRTQDEEGYFGDFGTPEADAKVGDVIVGGGEVIFIGDASEFDYKTENLNRIHYFAAWTLKDGVISGMYSSAHATTLPSVPYRPELCDYPLYTVPDILITDIAEPEYLGVINKEDNDSMAFRLFCNEDKYYQFLLPEIEAADESGLWFTFEFAMETDRGYSSNEEGNESSQTPMGNEPGKFGTGSMDVLCNNSVVYSINEYKGEMTSAGDNRFVSGSSTWQYEKVKIPYSADKKYSIGLRAKVPTSSVFYLKNILVENGSNGIDEIRVVSDGVTAVALPGKISLASSEDTNIAVYTIDGIVVANVRLGAGERKEVVLSAGMYIVNGKKFVVK